MALIKTPFGFSSTALEVAAGIDLTGRRAIVTGDSTTRWPNADRLWDLSLKLTSV